MLLPQVPLVVLVAQLFSTLRVGAGVHLGSLVVLAAFQMVRQVAVTKNSQIVQYVKIRANFTNRAGFQKSCNNRTAFVQTSACNVHR